MKYMTPKQIKKLRKALGMSLRDMADECLVSAQTIYNWESGKRKPDAEKTELLSILNRRAKLFETAVYKTKISR